MKTTKIFNKGLILVLLAIFFVSMLGFNSVDTKKTHALSSNYSGDPNTIYYFSDSDPILDYDTLTTEFGTYNIVYDIHNYVTAEEIYAQYGNSYFTGFGNNCIVIFEIKAEKLKAQWLRLLFSHLKTQNCTVVFVSAYELSEYSSTEFMSFVDEFYKCKKDRLFNFISNAVDHMANSNNTMLEDVNIFIDRRFFETESIEGKTIQELCDVSPYLRMLLKELGEQEGSYNREDSTSFSNIAGILLATGMHLLVHNGGNEYIDILTGVPYYLNNLDDVTADLNELVVEEQLLYAMGIWALQDSYYQLLDAIQDELALNFIGFPIYVLEEDEIDEEGDLEVISDADLFVEYEDEVDDAEELLNLLDSILN